VTALGDATTDPVRDLARYLAGEFRHGVPWRLTVRHPSATGYQLTDRLVSRLEVASALRLLPYRQRRVVELLCVADLPIGRVAQRLHVAERTVYADREQALALMALIIFRDQS